MERDVGILARVEADGYRYTWYDIEMERRMCIEVDELEMMIRRYVGDAFAEGRVSLQTAYSLLGVRGAANYELISKIAHKHGEQRAVDQLVEDYRNYVFRREVMELMALGNRMVG